MDESKTKTFMERAVLLSLNLHGIGNRKKVAKGRIKTAVDEDWLNVSKKLLDADSLKAINSHDADFKRWLPTRCVPGPLGGGSIYAVAVELVDEVDDRLTAFISKRNELAKVFCGEYTTLVEAAKDPLATEYDVNDYPSLEKVQRAFYVDKQWMTLQTPNVTTISEARRAKWEKETETRIKAAGDVITDALIVAMTETVSGMANALADNENGKKKVFRSSRIAQCNDFMEKLKFRNLGDNVELAQLAEQAKGLLSGTDAVILRSDGDLRKKVQEGFSEIKASLDKLIEDRPSRMISFEE